VDGNLSQEQCMIEAIVLKLYTQMHIHVVVSRYVFVELESAR